MGKDTVNAKITHLMTSSFSLNCHFESLIWTLLMNELPLSPHEAILPRMHPRQQISELNDVIPVVMSPDKLLTLTSINVRFKFL
jgi:hypothetical protein